MTLYVVTNNDVEKATFQSELTSRGWKDVTCVDYRKINGDSFKKKSIYVVDLDFSEDDISIFDQIVANAKESVIFTESEGRKMSSRSAYAWFNSLNAKIITIANKMQDFDGLLPQPEHTEPCTIESNNEDINECALDNVITINSEKVKRYATHISSVCVIGSSTGGPGALKEFFRSVRVVKGTTFIIAQHIGQEFINLLVREIQLLIDFDVSVITDGEMIKPNHVYLCPVSEITRVKTNHFMLEEISTEYRYTPSIDIVMMDIATEFKSRAMAVVLTGMGGDAENGVIAIRRSGGICIAQSADSCISKFMPEKVRQTGCVQHSGTPAELATLLYEYQKR